MLLQGFDVAEGGGILLISDVIREMLKIPCTILMGANIANEVAKEDYCEATIGQLHTRHHDTIEVTVFSDCRGYENIFTIYMSKMVNWHDLKNFGCY